MACALTACGGGGGGASDTAATTTTTAAATTSSAAQADKEVDAARLAKQATFGATPAVIDRIVSLGVSGWLDEQFAASGSTYADLTTTPWPLNTCGNDSACYYARYSRLPAAMRFYSNALSQPDQLRQRVALALGQIIVAGHQIDNQSAAGNALHNQIFLANAFGNYRDILQKITLSCFMGVFLDMDTSPSWSPNENYAREFLQLFTMGPNRLNMDGTMVKSANGGTIDNYSQDDVKGVARALTGWGCQEIGTTDFGNRALYDYTKPMKSLAYAYRYDDHAKTFLGRTVNGGDQNANVAAVIDAAFNNASTPPFISRQLIQHLVTANPTPAYVARVAAVFVNNGANVRGDLKAVVRAILTDAEARGTGHTGDADGKVKEPILLMTALARATGMKGDGWVLSAHDSELGQPLFQAPSVFNFYPPNYALPKSATLQSPASKLISTGSVVLRHNLIHAWTVAAATTPAEFAPSTEIAGTTGSAQDWSGWEAFGADLDGMIDRVDLLLTARSLSAGQKAALKTAALAISNANAATQARLRAQMLLYVVAQSPFFQVDR